MVGVALVALGVGACPPPPRADRPDATACATTRDCNPAGMACGELFLCVQGLCSSSTVAMVCAEGGTPLQGNCGSYLDCNGALTCGPALLNCSGNSCDLTGPRINIPCPDAGPEPTLDARADAPREGGSDAGFDAREGG